MITLGLDETGVREQTLQLAQSYQSLLLEQRFDEWIELWAEDGTCEFPFAHESRRRVYQGKREILTYMSATPGRIAIDAVTEMRVHSMLDPGVAAFEFAINGRLLTTGRPYNQRYVAFLEVKDGKIWRYREYWNPLVSMEAHGGLDEWLSADTETLSGEAS